MPRVTRAALRLNPMLEETNLAASTPLPLTPVPNRAHLGEITGNSGEVKAVVREVESSVKAQKKAPLKGRRGKTLKNAKKITPNARSEESIEVIEDDNQSATSSAVDEACHELMKEPSGEIHQIVMHDQRPHTPPSPAVVVVKKHLSSYTKTSTSHSSSVIMSVHSQEKHDDAPTHLGSPETAVLLTVTNATDKEQSREEPGKGHEEKNDLILDQIMTRSPAQLITRIEDSVEAIDAFEEAIEKVGELIPAISEGPRSPAKVKVADVAHESNDQNVGSSISYQTGLTSVSRPSSVKPKRMTTRATSAFQRRKTSNMSVKVTPKPLEESDRGLAPVVSATFSATGATSTRANPKRVSSIHNAPFLPAKSTKPLTRSSFELPGDAVARKLKEQREERLKRGGEEPKKPVFKARPARLSQAPVVRQTALSSARLSLAKTDFKKADVLQERTSANKSISRQRSISTADTQRRLSTISVAKPTRPSLTTNTRDPVRNRSMSVVSTHAPPGPPRAPMVVPDTAQLKLRGKEVFNRNRVELDERERARKEKEEAARRARAEAAERGRIASREWAEKQRMKKMAVEKDNQGVRASMGK